MIGGLLVSNGYDENEWKNVLNDKIWENTNIIPSLRLSYFYLPLGVQSCFAYCSIFPKDYLFSMEQVIMLWVGEGLMEKFCEGNQYEDVARAYFTHLRSKFFFQESSSSGSKFVMHDLVHDLALHVSRGLLVDFRNITLQSRRLSYLQGKDEPLLDNVSGIKLNRLRTFLPLIQNLGTGFYLKKKLLGELLSNFKLLRVLSLNRYHISTLPKSLGDMKLLRLLDLSSTQIDHLPHMICRLYNLQILLLSYCQYLKRLPADICCLVNLRHLAINETGLKVMPDGIGRMTNIRTLSNFVIGRGKYNQMREFKELINLQGKLHISGLDNVKDANDVVVAGFKQKEILEELVLEWQPTGEQDEKVLDAIEAHKNLKSLTMKGYGGKRLSDWIVGVSPSFTAMVSLSIINCFNCEALPSLGNLPFLKDLKMRRLDRLEYIGEEFYGDSHNPFQALEKLNIDGMKVLKTWCFPGGDDKVAFQVLQDLQIRSCPKLTKIPYCFPSLSRLVIQFCNNLVKVEMCGEQDEKVLDAIEAHKNLKSLTIKGYGGKRLSDWIVGVSPSFTAMVSLSITDCFNCETLPSLGDLPFLKHLEMQSLDRVEYIGEEFYGDSHNPFQALEKLIIDGMKVFKTWWFPEGDILGFQMLQDLQIVRCPELTKISYCFPSLSQLLIESCDNLVKFEMCGEEGSSSACRHHPFQSIRFSSCPKLEEIPNNFLNSDSYDIKDCKRLVSEPRLQNVRNLTLTDVGASLRVEAAVLQECRDGVLEELTIGISLSDLNNAEIHRFTSLKRLKLKVSRSEDEDGEVMIRLPPNLSDFIICGGTLHERTKILTELSNLNSVTKLELSECGALESLPDVALPSTLKCLIVYDCSGIRNIPDRLLSGCSESLQELRIKKCRNLMCLPSTLSALHSLQTLHIGDCDGIHQLPTISGSDPNFLTNLSDLRISHCRTLECLPDGFDKATALHTFYMENCPNLCVTKDRFPANLKNLRISDCGKMNPFVKKVLPKLISLTHLELRGFPDITTLDCCLPETIQTLQIWSFPRLKSLTGVLSNLKHLRILEVENCPRVDPKSWS